MSEKVLMKGNEALAEAAIRAGCHHFFGYPITPQTELAAYMAKRLPKIEGGVFLQAESEVAAINMVMGAAAAGARVMTSSSSPGISLKSEGVSYIAGCDLPCLIINIQRGGPGLGGIQPSQADYFQATKALGHGDYQLIVLAPSSVQEMVDLAYKAFELGDTYRTPVMILGDGALGQMMEPVELPQPSDANKHDKSWATTGHQNKREHNIINSLYMEPSDLERTIIERYKRYDTIKDKEVMCEQYLVDDADFIVVAYGMTARIAKSAVNTLRSQNIKAGLIRPITLWPFPQKEIAKAAQSAKAFLVVEMSMGQMVEDVKLAVNGKKEVKFFGRTGGVIPTPAEVVEHVKALRGGAE